MKKIVVIGEVLVEIMADTVGAGFGAPQALTGPFPSGAPAIFADQAAKLGQPVGIVSAVGNDDFGRLNIERLSRDGVECKGIAMDEDRPTGSAFVRYRSDSTRDFVFNIKHSACGHLHDSGGVRALLGSADHLHVMGSSLSSAEFVALNLATAEDVKARGGSVSFDPNVRREILGAPGLLEAMIQILGLTDLFLPSGEELTLLTAATEEKQAVAELLGIGVKAVVHKNGSEGAAYHDASGSCATEAFAVDEVDPTGAGDCFGGAFTTFWLRGEPAQEALRKAAAAGARAVTRRGPMEGTSTDEEIDAFLKQVEDRGTVQ